MLQQAYLFAECPTPSQFHLCFQLQALVLLCQYLSRLSHQSHLLWNYGHLQYRQVSLGFLNHCKKIFDKTVFHKRNINMFLNLLNYKIPFEITGSKVSLFIRWTMKGPTFDCIWSFNLENALSIGTLELLSRLYNLTSLISSSFPWDRPYTCKTPVPLGWDPSATRRALHGTHFTPNSVKSTDFSSITKIWGFVILS